MRKRFQSKAEQPHLQALTLTDARTELVAYLQISDGTTPNFFEPKRMKSPNRRGFLTKGGGIPRTRVRISAKGEMLPFDLAESKQTNSETTCNKTTKLADDC